jgi:hypothetical protein
VIGPILCKMAIKKVDEQGKDENAADHDDHGDDIEKRNRALVVGLTVESMGLCQRLLKADWDLTVLDTDAKRLSFAASLVPNKEGAVLSLLQQDPGQLIRRLQSRDGDNSAPESAADKHGLQINHRMRSFSIDMFEDTPASPRGAASAGGVFDASPALGPGPAPASPRAAAAATSASAAFAPSTSTYQLIEQNAQRAAAAEAALDGGAGVRLERRDSFQSLRVAESDEIDLNAQSNERMSLKLMAKGPHLSAVKDLTLDFNEQGFKAVYLFLPTDEATLEVGRHFVQEYKHPNVIASIHHPGYAPLLASLGIVPLQEMSTVFQVMQEAATPPDNFLTFTRVPKLHMPPVSHSTVANSAVDPDDFLLRLRMLPKHQQTALLKRYPPPQAQINRIERHMNVDFGGLPENLREEFLTDIVNLSNNVEVPVSADLKRRERTLGFTDPMAFQVMTLERRSSLAVAPPGQNPQNDGGPQLDQ